MYCKLVLCTLVLYAGSMIRNIQGTDITSKRHVQEETF